MANLTLKRGGVDRVFLPSGKVVLVDSTGNSTEKGSWAVNPDRNTNRLDYSFDGVDDEVDIQYEFNDLNQLVAFFPAAANEGADSEKVTFQGRIVIDDNRDVAYDLFDDSGAATNRKLTVHGDIAFSDALNELIVTLAGGQGTTVIRGDQSLDPDKVPLEPGKNKRPDAEHKDTIRFRATTSNEFNGVERDDDAIVLFVGSWDLTEDGLAFHAKGDSGAFTVQLTAKVGAVSAGLAYFHDAEGQRIAFIVKGQHRFKNDGGTGSANWELFLGHSDKKLEAKFTAGLTLDGPNRKVKINGSLEFLSGPTGKTIKASLDAKVEIKGGELIFSADVASSGSGGLNYNLLLEGKYKVKGGDFRFQVKLAGNQDDLTLNLNAAFETSTVKAHIEVVLRKTPSGGTTVSFEVGFTMKAHWIDGVLFKPDEPIALAAA